MNEASQKLDLSAGTGLPTATFDGGAAQKLGVGGYSMSDAQGNIQLVRVNGMAKLKTPTTKKSVNH